MFRTRRIALILGLAGAMAGLPTVFADDQDRHRDDRNDGSVAEAVRFERAKDAAAERQARLEARGGGDRDGNAADRVASDGKSRSRSSRAARKTPPPPRDHPQQ